MNQRDIADAASPRQRQRTSGWRLVAVAALVATLSPLAAAAPLIAATSNVPETVYFPSSDGKTTLVGYLFLPGGLGPHPAAVMLHGRRGPYSVNINAGCTFVGKGRSSPCGARSLSKRHMQWGEFWKARGYVALHVDSFGPRGEGHGFSRGTHGEAVRDSVNERTVRPLDAEGALAYLRTRPDVLPRAIGLQGWSNGGSTVLNVMQRQADGTSGKDAPQFRAALSFYPGCGPAALLEPPYQARDDLLVFLGSADEEVSPTVCREKLDAAVKRGSPVEIVWYDGATHDFDDPGHKRQGEAADRSARDDAMKRAETFFAGRLGY